MIQILQNIIIFIIVYLMPIPIFIKLARRKGINMVMVALICIFSAILSLFTENYIPASIVIVNIFLMYMLREEDFYKYNFNIKSLKISKALKYAATSYGITFIISAISGFILSLFFKNLNQQEVVTELKKSQLIPFIFSIPSLVIFAPILEEFVFRWLFFEKIFKKRIGFIWGAVISSIMFGIAHFNLESFFVITILGLINCYLIEKKGYWYAVVNHAFFNSITVCMILFQKI